MDAVKEISRFRRHAPLARLARGCFRAFPEACSPLTSARERVAKSEARATVSKSMRGRRRDPHPLFRRRYHHCRCRYHPRRLLSLFGNLSSDAVQLSSVAPLGRCGSRAVASSRKLSRARAISRLSLLFFSEFTVRLSLLRLPLSLLSQIFFFSREVRKVHELGKEEIQRRVLQAFDVSSRGSPRLPQGK